QLLQSQTSFPPYGSQPLSFIDTSGSSTFGKTTETFDLLNARELHICFVDLALDQGEHDARPSERPTTFPRRSYWQLAAAARIAPSLQGSYSQTHRRPAVRRRPGPLHPRGRGATRSYRLEGRHRWRVPPRVLLGAFCRAD